MNTLKKILAVAVIAGSAQSAFAYWDTGVDLVNKSGVNDGEMILTIWDTDAQQSYTQDTGIRFSSLISGAGLNGQTIALDPTALSVFGASVNESSVRWALVAANSHVKNGTTNAYTNAGYMATVASGTVLTLPAGNIGTNVNAAWSAFNPYQVNLVMNDPASPIANEVRSGTAAGQTTDVQYQSSFADNFLAAKGYGIYGSGTQDLWFTGFAVAAGTSGKVVDLGTVSLDFTSKSLTLGAPVAQTPVPAAIWLMGSALAGLGSIARRRRSV